MNEVEVIKENRVGLLNKEASKRTVMPVYVWKTGRRFFLSKKEKCVADTFLETRSYVECSRELLRMGIRKNWLTCRRWLERSHIKEYMAEQFEERGMAAGWSREHWLKVMTDHLMGRERLREGDLYGMKLIASVLKFEMPDHLSVTQINFMEGG